MSLCLLRTLAGTHFPLPFPLTQLSWEWALLLLQLKVKGSLALGYVALDAVVQYSLQLINSGLKTASYRVEVESGLPLQVNPTDGKLTPTGSPDSVCTLKLELAAEIAGPMSGTTQLSSISETLLCHLSWSPVMASWLCTLLPEYWLYALLLAQYA